MNATAEYLGLMQILRRDGSKGLPFPLTLSEVLIGSGDKTEIRINLPTVDSQHAKLYFVGKKVNQT